MVTSVHVHLIDMETTDTLYNPDAARRSDDSQRKLIGI
jgi:hypothetical protein